MIKKIFLLLLTLVVCLFLVVFYLVDKIFISKYIKNLEDNLNVSITLKEPHNLKIVPNLSLLAKFNLEKNKKKIFFNDGELNIQKDYNLNKPFFNFNSNDQSFFNGKVIYDDEYIYIDNLKASNNEYNIILVGEYDLKNEFVNIESIVEFKNEKIFEINTLGNIDNPNITIFSMDKAIDMNFNIKDINQILSGNYEDFFQNLLTNE